MCGAPLVALSISSGALDVSDIPETEATSSAQLSLPIAPPPADAPVVPLAGERRVATIVVADVRGSTDLLEQVGTEAWVELMNQVLQLLEAEIYHFGGTVDQFRGDGLVAFFGATSAHEDDPERAVLAALWMQKAVKSYAVELHRREGIDLQIRVGVNTGEVIVTSVGEQHSEDTAMGEAIAIAARMESAAEPGTILVSENTYRRVDTRFEWHSLGEIMVKGVSYPIAVYRPLGLQMESGREQGLRSYDFSIPMIGRSQEYLALKSSVEDLYDERGGIAVVSGDKGMGKTLLVGRVRNYLERHGMLLAEARSREVALPALVSLDGQAYPPVVTWLAGRCRSYDQSWPYSMWLDMLQNWLGMRYEDAKEEIGARLRQRAELLWGERFVEYYPYLAKFLSLPLEEEFVARTRHLDAEGSQRLLFRAVYSWVNALAERGPLVLSFADMHWADTSSLALLKHCLPLCDSNALLWLVVFRPDRTSPVWEFRHYVETEYPHRLLLLALFPLDPQQSAELIARLIGTRSLAEPILDLVVQKAEGNPYYIKELINAMISQNILVLDPASGTWNSTRPVTSLDLPDSLQNLLLARIDRLSAEARHVLQAAAVIGTVFWLDVLQFLLGDLPQLRAHLTSLQRGQLIHERRRVPNIGMEYAFNSSLLRDVAYEGLLRPQREAYHLKVSDYFENLLELGDGRMQRYGMVAYHYRQAERLEKALTYTLKAAEQARSFYANAEALRHYTLALEVLDQMLALPRYAETQYELRKQRFYVSDERREIYYLLGDMASGREDALAMLDQAQHLQLDPQLLVDALLEQPGVGSIQGRQEREVGIGIAYRALELARNLQDPRREMQSLIAITNLHNLRNESNWQDTGYQALELARSLGDQRAEVNILLRLGWAYGVDNLDLSMEYFQKALAVAEGVDDKASEIRLLSALRTSLERTGDYYRMLVEYEQKRLQLSREIGDRYAEGSALVFCGQLLALCLGDYEAGLALEEEALQIWENTTGKLYPLLCIVQIHERLGNYEQALNYLELAKPLGEEDVRETGRAGLGLVTAVLYNAIGDEAHLYMALESVGGVHRMVGDSLVSRQYDMAAFCEEAAAHQRLVSQAADLETQYYHRDAALGASQAALNIYDQFGFVQIVECSSEEIFYRHSEILLLHGRSDAAQSYLRKAHAEIMRKYALIPEDSAFRDTYLENIALHCDIRTAYAELAPEESDGADSVDLCAAGIR